ncbi:MAG: CARDB domain-containing protein, partial [Thermoplasmata archaeon]
YPYMNPFNRLSSLFLALSGLSYSEGNVDGDIYYGIGGQEKHIFEINEDQNDYEENLFDLETFGSEIEDIEYEGDDFTKDLFVRIENTGTANITFDPSQQNLWSSFDNDMRLQDSNMTVINSFIDVDYNPSDVDPRPGESEATTPDTHRVDSNTDHRVIRVYDSEFRAHGIQVQGEPTADGDPPFVEWGDSFSEIFRWVQVEAYDSTGETVEGAQISTDPVMDLDSDEYEDVRDYLGYNYEGEYLESGVYETGETGKTTMVLRSDTLEFPGDWPNGNYTGSYTLEGSYDLENDTYTTSKQIGLDSFPDLSESANNPQYSLEFDVEIPLPDLNIVDLTVDGETDPDDLVVNRTVDINLTFSNDGEKEANDISVDFSLDGNLIEDGEISNIGPSEEENYNFTWTPGEGDSGTKELTARLDPDGEIYEREKQDQEESITLNINERPDLWVEEISLEGEYAEGEQVKEGEQVYVISTVSNIGETGVEEINVTLELDGVEIDRRSVDLAPNEEKDVTFTWEAPQQTGSHTLSSEINPEGEIDESDDTNNFATIDVEIVSGPDLSIEYFNVLTEDETTFEGDTVTIEAIIANDGEWHTDNVEVTIYLDRGEDTEEEIHFETIDPIEGSDSETITTTWEAEMPENIDERSYDRSISVAVQQIGGEEITDGPITVTVEKQTELTISDVSLDRDEATEGEEVTIAGQVDNVGNFAIEEYTLYLYVDGEEVDNTTFEDLISEDSREFEFTWAAEITEGEVEGNRILTLEIGDTQPKLTTEPGVVEESILVKSQPDLQIDDYRVLVEGQEVDAEGGFQLMEMDELTIQANVTNMGGSPIEGAVFEAVFPDGTTQTETLSVDAGGTENVQVKWTVVMTESEISLRVNSTVGDDATTYDENIIDDFETESMSVELVDFSIPEDPQPGETYFFEGTFQRESDGKPLVSGMEVTISIEDADGEVIDTKRGTVEEDGKVSVTLQIPEEDGEYNVVYDVQDSQGSSFSESMSIATESAGIAGIPWWLFLVIAAIAVGGVGSVYAYTKYFGIGEMVECGNCGATISADATSCPKCGVEFDMDTVKCSECGEWIPADSDTCPECGAEFVKTGKEVQDYTERMRQQYKKFVRQQKRKAEEELDKELSQKGFMDWWKDQPSFVTFEDWMERKEKQRREGSKECPECGSLNSVDAAVCQKCGTSLIDVDVVGGGEEGKEEEGGSEEDLLVQEPSDEEEAEETEETEETEKSADVEEEKGGEEETEKKEKTKRVKKKPKKKVKKRVVKKKSKDED